MAYDPKSKLWSDRHDPSSSQITQGQQHTWFALLLSQLPACLWELDPVSKAGFQLLSAGNGAPIEKRPLIDPPASLIRSGVVHADSISVLERLFSDVYTGKNAGSCTVRMLLRDGVYYWENIAFTQHVGTDGRRKVLGVAIPICKDLLTFSEEFEEQHALWNLLSATVIAASRANLTRDMIDHLIVNTDRAPAQRIRTYGQMALLGARTITDETTKVQYYQTLGRDALLEAFKAGKRSVVFYYMRIRADGTSGWICATANLCMEPASGDIYAFGYIQDADARRHLEQALQAPILLDPVTGLYTDAIGRALGRLALEQVRQSDGYSMLFLLEIRNYAVLSNEFGTHCLDDSCRLCAQLLHLCFVSHGITTSHGLGCISILLPCISSAQKSTMQALLDGALLLYARLLAGDGERPAFDVSATIAPAGTQRFEEMLAACKHRRAEASFGRV